MQQDELRQLIREAIAAELGPDAGRRGLAREPREEIVSIGSDAELATFVGRLLDMADHPKTRDDIRAGRLKFKLAGGTRCQRGEVQQAPQQQRVTLPPGVVTERQVNALPEGTTHVVIGEGVRLTPLARDRLRELNLCTEKIERVLR